MTSLEHITWSVDCDVRVAAGQLITFGKEKQKRTVLLLRVIILSNLPNKLFYNTASAVLQSSSDHYT